MTDQLKILTLLKYEISFICLLNDDLILWEKLYISIHFGS